MQPPETQSHNGIMHSAPLLVTLDMDPAAFAFFDALRQAHFPRERNYLNAHITLFHHLPGNEEETIRAQLAETAGNYPPFMLHVRGLWMLGFGVAYRLQSEPAVTLRTALAALWQEWLTPQDRLRPFSPHITVQNKVTSQKAKALHAELSAEFRPFTIMGTGLTLYRYLGGPWQELATFPFPTHAEYKC